MYLREHEINILPSSALLPQFSCPFYSLFLPLLEGPLLAMPCNCHCVTGVNAPDLICKYFMRVVISASKGLPQQRPFNYLARSCKRVLASCFTPSHLTLIRESVNEI